MSALLLILATGAVLWALWAFMSWTFDLMERAQERLREQAAADPSGEDAQATEGKGS